MSKALFIVSGSGRLANRIYRFANICAYAIEHNNLLVDTSFRDYGYVNFFEKFKKRSILCSGPSSSIISRIPRSILDKLLQALGRRMQYLYAGDSDDYYDLSKLEERQGRLFSIGGLQFISPELMIKHREAIRDILQIRKDIVYECRCWLSNTSSEGTKKIGVHVRQTDFVGLWGGEFTISLEESLDYAISTFGGNVELIVVSDQPVLLPEQWKGVKVHVHSGDLFSDLTILALCDAVVGSAASTFSTYAAWYSQIPKFSLYKKENQVCIFTEGIPTALIAGINREKGKRLDVEGLREYVKPYNGLFPT